MASQAKKSSIKGVDFWIVRKDQEVVLSSEYKIEFENTLYQVISAAKSVSAKSVLELAK